MVGELGAAKYFEPVRQPDTANREAMGQFYTNFTEFMIADIRCRQGEGRIRVEQRNQDVGERCGLHR